MVALAPEGRPDVLCPCAGGDRYCFGAGLGESPFGPEGESAVGIAAASCCRGFMPLVGVFLELWVDIFLDVASELLPLMCPWAPMLPAYCRVRRLQLCRPRGAHLGWAHLTVPAGP